MNNKICILFSFIFIISCSSNIVQQKLLKNVDLPSKWLNDNKKNSAFIQNIKIESKELKNLLQQVVNKNYSLKSLAKRLLATKSLIITKQSELYPNVSIGVQKQTQEILKPTKTQVNNYSLGLNVGWEIDVWKKLAFIKKASILNYKSQVLDLQATKNTLLASVSRLWYSSISAKLKIKAVKTILNNSYKNLKIVQNNYQKGFAKSHDINLAKARVAGQQNILQKHQLTLHKFIRDLEVLLGYYPKKQLAIIDKLPEIQTDIPAGIPAKVLQNRPDILSAQIKIAALDYQAASIARSRFPSFSLNASYKASSDELNNITKGDFFLFSLIGNISYPLFNAGKLKSLSQQAKLNVEASSLLYTQTVLNAFKEIENYLEEEQSLKQQEKYLIINNNELTLAEEKIKLSYNLGLASFIELLNIENQRLNANNNLLDIKNARLQNRINLFQALGGNFSLNLNKIQ